MEQIKKMKSIIYIFTILLLSTNILFGLYFSYVKEQRLSQLETILRQKIIGGEIGGAKEILHAFIPLVITKYEINLNPTKAQKYNLYLYYDYNKEKIAAGVNIEFNNSELYWILFFANLTVLSLLALSIYFMRLMIKKEIQIRSDLFDSYLYNLSIFMDKKLSINNSDYNTEAQKKFTEKLSQFMESKIKAEKEVSIGKIAAQVSHDIRSPLSALNTILDSLNQFSEEKRILIRSSVQRINDIANQLLQISRKQNEKNSLIKSNETPIVLLSSIIDYLISEKRMQFREKPNVIIEANLSHSYGIFCQIEPNEIKRILSNLINNSVEAFNNESGKVRIEMSMKTEEVTLVISDNGKGIPKHILNKIGEQGVTYGKKGSESGNGLGVYHAKQIIEGLKGKFGIESQEGNGTNVVITLPVATPPKWFVKNLEIFPTQKIVVLDDDISIHSIWKGRLQSLHCEEFGISLISFTSGSDFKSWFLKQPTESRSLILYLIDFELLNQMQTGLDLIEELKINAYLVTSRYEEHSIINRCETLGIGLIPKGMAGLIPINLSGPKEIYDWILIDDDPLIRLAWKLAAKEQHKKFLGFSNFEDFQKESHKIINTSNLYIDANLGDQIRGEDVAEKAALIGFQNIYIATGYDPEEIRKSSAIKAVLGKDPPGKS